MENDLQSRASTATTRSGAAGDARQLQLLVETGLLLASQRNAEVIAQTALDAGMRLSGACYGAFFYNFPGGDGEPCQLRRIAGPESVAFASLATPLSTAILTETFPNYDVVRSPDMTKDVRVCSSPFAKLHGTPVCCSYLAVPVRGRDGQVLGGLLYGHPDRDIFQPESESLVATVASQAAVALDNARLAEDLTREIGIADAARALQRQTAERLRQALEAAQLGTWTWDRASDLLDLDERAAQMLDAQPHTPVTRSALRSRIVTEEDRQYTTDSLRQAIEHGGLYTAEYRVDRSDGQQTWVASSGVLVLRAGSDEITGMIGTTQDITARKTSEATLRQSEKLAATGRLAATIAHEINNPLEAVTNLIYPARPTPKSPATRSACSKQPTMSWRASR